VEGGDCLTVIVPVAVVLAVAVFLLCRYAGLRVLHALICIILGFYLASTGLAPEITHLTHSLLGLLSSSG
jgi:hypothetical protein